MMRCQVAYVVVQQEGLRAMLCALLPSMGYQVATFSRLAAALSASATEQPDLLLIESDPAGLAADDGPARLASDHLAPDVPIIGVPASLGRLPDARLSRTLLRSFLVETLPPMVRPTGHRDRPPGAATPPVD
jgi:hypothetical protein